MASESLGRYGKRVLGDEKFEREQKVKKKAADRYGPRVTGNIDDEDEPVPAPKRRARPAEPQRQAEKPAATKEPPPPPEKKGPDGGTGGAPEGAAAGEIEGLNVSDVKAALEANPNLVDPFFEAELERDKPRVTALRAMVDAEGRREGGPRDAVLDALEFAVNQAEADGE